MKYRCRLLIMTSAVICLSLASIASADSCIKTLYIDGAYVEQAEPNSGLSWSYDRITIGSEGNRWYLYNGYIGKMDEFAIYAGVLDAGRIAAHYSAKSTSYASYTAEVQADSPLLYLQFEDASTSNGDPAESTGSVDRDGTYISSGTGSITQTAGIAAGSTAIVLPGDEPDAPGSCVDVWDGTGDFAENLEGDVTIELWANYTNTSDYPRFFQHNGSWENEGSYGVMVNGPNQLGVIGGDYTDYMTTPYDINDGGWHHIVVTYDSTYEPIDTNSYPEEVMADNPVLWLRFEDVEPQDYSGNNRWVGYGGGTSVVEKAGGIGKSAYFGGAGYGAAATNGPNEPPLEGSSYEVYGDEYAFAPNDITFELWYKTLPPDQPQPGDYAIFFQQLGPSGNEPRAPGVSNSTGQIRIFGGSGAGYTGVSPAFDQHWHHMVVTYDEEYGGDPNTMYVQLYLDGVFEDDTTFTGPDAKLGPELSHILVGAENNIGGPYNQFPGYVDEFAIYEGILDPNRVLIHYLAWQPKSCAELWDRGTGIAADMDKDCDVDFLDFASFASEWILCNDPCDANCVPNW